MNHTSEAPSAGNGWQKWQEHVLQSLERLEGEIAENRREFSRLLSETKKELNDNVKTSVERVEKQLTGLEQERKGDNTTTQEWMRQIEGEVKLLNYKSGILGALAGGLSAGVTVFLSFFRKGAP
jgi:hypothetical protein